MKRRQKLTLLREVDWYDHQANEVRRDAFKVTPVEKKAGPETSLEALANFEREEIKLFKKLESSLRL